MTGRIVALHVLSMAVIACSSPRTHAPANTRAAQPEGASTSSPSPVAEPVLAARPAFVTPAVDAGSATPMAQGAPPSSSSAVVAGNAPPSGLTVVDATFTHRVEGRQPTDRVSSLHVGERAAYLVVVRNEGSPSEVTIEWRRGEEVLSRQGLAVGTARAWRTWALRTVTARDSRTGLDVRVLDSDGRVLFTDHAQVLAASAG